MRTRQLAVLVLIVLLAPAVLAQRISDSPLRPLPRDNRQLVATLVSVTEMPKGVSLTRQRQAGDVAKLLREGKEPEALKQWGNLVRGLKMDKIGDGSVMEVLFVVLQQSHLEAREDLRQTLEQLRANNKQKSAIRSHLADVREEVKAAAAGPRRFAPADPQMRIVGSELAKLAPRSMTRLELSAEQRVWQDKLDTTSEMGESLQLNLQRLMERHAQLITTLSNILKKMHETTNTIIQNMKS
jgi:hypothetical protein